MKLSQQNAYSVRCSINWTNDFHKFHRSISYFLVQFITAIEKYPFIYLYMFIEVICVNFWTLFLLHILSLIENANYWPKNSLRGNTAAATTIKQIEPLNKQREIQIKLKKI